MALLVRSENHDDEEWARRLREHDPEIDVRIWPDLDKPEEIDMVLVAQVPDGLFGQLPNLKAIMKLGAGVNNILDDPHRPEGVPLARLVDPLLVVEMAQWAIYALFHFHRRVPEYAALRERRDWTNLGATDPEDTRVGIMGIGAIGGDVAREIAHLGFPVSGWSRTAKRIDGVRCYHGWDQLDDFLSVSDFMLSVLPMTPETEGIIDKDRIAKLPRGAVVANIGRGGQQNEEDILAALDSGHLSGAALDVFQKEPLPQDSPFWTHPKVLMTPHVAGFARPKTAAAQVAENYRRARAGEALLNAVDFTRGY
ncbi:MAG: glyoxylate/hydroxypyruvate reductase A [Proteobacteria bacterium]|nr:glyoxylate/hydroxypyruvate reductase A [Pseudomonadota bacterium]